MRYHPARGGSGRQRRHDPHRPGHLYRREQLRRGGADRGHQQDSGAARRLQPRLCRLGPGRPYHHAGRARTGPGAVCHRRRQPHHRGPAHHRRGGGQWRWRLCLPGRGNPAQQPDSQQHRCHRRRGVPGIESGHAGVEHHLDQYGQRLGRWRVPGLEQCHAQRQYDQQQHLPWRWGGWPRFDPQRCPADRQYHLCQ